MIAESESEFESFAVVMTGVRVTKFDSGNTLAVFETTASAWNLAQATPPCLTPLLV